MTGAELEDDNSIPFLNTVQEAIHQKGGLYFARRRRRRRKDTMIVKKDMKEDGSFKLLVYTGRKHTPVSISISHHTIHSIRNSGCIALISIDHTASSQNQII